VAADVPDHLVGEVWRIAQILINLIGNAIKFTSAGEVGVRVSARRPSESGEVIVRFAVSDTGIGISPEQQSRIFEPFKQADGSTTRKYGGTGLGLSISGRLVERMGGRIWVESEAGQGSTFHVELPLALGSSIAAAASAPIADLRGVRVLVVDDNRTNRRLIHDLAVQWEMRPEIADSGAAAIVALDQAYERGEAFPLVLLDAHMPGVDGFEVAGHIRRRPALAGATVLMLTSDDRAGDQARCRELGMSSCLVKPLTRAALLSAITSALAAGAGRPAAARRVVPRPEGSSGLRVLLAEDNPVNQRVASALLAREGHAVTIVATGVAAIAAVSSQQFDVIFMDVQMPEMGGLEATAAIRQLEKCTGTRIRIIAMTAHAMHGDRERCMEAGMDDYVAKPIRIDELREALRQVAADRTPRVA
jgi:two-component system sensor histidine kinase/response regulator